MAKDFLPKVITWFRLDEHVKRLKEFVDSLTTRIETLENAGGGEIPNLLQVTTEGNTTDKDIISEHASQVRVIEVKQTITNAAAGLYATGLLKLRNVLGWTANLSGGNLTADRTFEFPDSDGTIALLTDITPSQLQLLTEAGQTGWRLLGKTATRYGNIGINAVDFSENDLTSSTRGATGLRAFATGYRNTASGINSFTGGSMCTASSDQAFAVGNTNTSSAINAFTSGGNNTANNANASAINSSNTASGQNSFASGLGNFAPSFSEHVAGIYGTTYVPGNANALDSTDRAFNVGNGTSDVARSDAFSVYKNGNSVFGGTVRLKNYTVATLPIGVLGDTAIVTDATAPTYLGALVGGGAVKCPVFFNGVAWVSH